MAKKDDIAVWDWFARHVLLGAALNRAGRQWPDPDLAHRVRMMNFAFELLDERERPVAIWFADKNGFKWKG